jgi:hypothetical protein
MNYRPTLPRPLSDVSPSAIISSNANEFSADLFIYTVDPQPTTTKRKTKTTKKSSLVI